MDENDLFRWRFTETLVDEILEEKLLPSIAHEVIAEDFIANSNKSLTHDLVCSGFYAQLSP